LGSIIVGVVVSQDVWLSIGALQSFLAITAFYYSMANYRAPALMLKIGLPMGAVGVLIPLILASGDTEVIQQLPHGLGIGGLIIAAIFFGIAISRQRLALRAVSGLLCSFFTAAVKFLAV
jgi:hypothetical protein